VTDLGHKNIGSTLLYIQLEQAMYENEPDAFTSRVAKTVEEARQLEEA